MSHRAAVLRVLERYLERFPDDARMVERIRALVCARPDCFERSCEPGHITASAWIVSSDHRRCLLTHHRKLDRWLQLGGHADGVTDVLQVALAEAREESGMRDFVVFGGDDALPIDVDVHDIPARHAGARYEPAHEHHDLRYLLIAPADQQIEVSDESHDVRWFEWDELEAVLAIDPSIARLIERSRRLLGVESA